MFRGEALRRNVALVQKLQQFAEVREFPLSQLAIAWTLSNPAVDVAIVGARTPLQIEQNAPAADIHLATSDLGEIERIMREAVPVGGPSPEATLAASHSTTVPLPAPLASRWPSAFRATPHTGPGWPSIAQISLRPPPATSVPRPPGFPPPRACRAS